MSISFIPPIPSHLQILRPPFFVAEPQDPGLPSSVIGKTQWIFVEYMQYTNIILGPMSIHGTVESELHILARKVGKHLCSEIFIISKTLLWLKIQFAYSCEFYKRRIRTCIYFSEATVPENKTIQ